MQLKPWPQHDIEHELRSVRMFLRQFPDCPDEVRVNRTEGAFMRPSIVLRLVDGSEQALGSRLITKNRTIAVTWYSADEDDEQAARLMYSWMLSTLARGDGAVRGGLIKLYDFSESPTLTDTGHGIEVTEGSVSADIIMDADNRWMVPVTLRYSVRFGTASLYATGTPVDLPNPVTVTDIVSTTEIE